MRRHSPPGQKQADKPPFLRKDKPAKVERKAFHTVDALEQTARASLRATCRPADATAEACPSERHRVFDLIYRTLSFIIRYFFI